MSAVRNIKRVYEDWEEVYLVKPVTRELFSDEELVSGYTYYQTYGGGPEGGYFVKEDGVYEASRRWFKEFEVKFLEHKRLEFEPADELRGKTARCRLYEEVDLTATRKIVDEHLLWGNTIEIVKALRDGLGRAGDASYKDLCLGIVLHHFQYIDKYLDLLPSDSCPSYKEVLHNLKVREEDSDEDSDSEDDLELQEAYREGKKDGYEEAYSEIHECEECHKPTKEVLQKCDGTERQDVLFVCKACEKTLTRSNTIHTSFESKLCDTCWG
jgi:hypothetical protein